MNEGNFMCELVAYREEVQGTEILHASLNTWWLVLESMVPLQLEPHSS